MPALNFKKQFVEEILSGEKKQTIRAMRKRPFKVGDRLYLYTGMRTKQCKKIGEAVCTKVEHIKIYYKNDILNVKLKGRILSFDELNYFAVYDGFNGVFGFIGFFKDITPFSGQIIYWEKIE